MILKKHHVNTQERKKINKRMKRRKSRKRRKRCGEGKKAGSEKGREREKVRERRKGRKEERKREKKPLQNARTFFHKSFCHLTQKQWTISVSAGPRGTPQQETQFSSPN